jgi:hypothetical protein
MFDPQRGAGVCVGNGAADSGQFDEPAKIVGAFYLFFNSMFT